MQGSFETEIGFPEASTLVFENLPSFQRFASVDLIVKWPSLEDITVSNCPKIRPFGLGDADVSQFKRVDVEPQSQEDVHSEVRLAQLFRLSDTFSSKEAFEIDDAELSKILAMKPKPSHFTNLVRLQAKHCDERLNEFLPVLLERSKRFERLTIKKCRLSKHVFDFSRLLMSTSAAENLKQLHVLILHSCEMVEVVVAMETDGLETQKRIIEFTLLKELELIRLPNFIKFHRGNCALEFPSLNFLRIKDCPEMISFTTGFAGAEELSITDERPFPELRELELDACGKLIYVISSAMLPMFQKLKKLAISNCDSLADVIHFHGEFYPAAPLLQQLSELILSHLPNLMHVISMEFASIKFFQNLQILRVNDCNSLKYLFLPFEADSIMLRELEISDCKDLAEIFVTKGKENSGKFSFSNLSSIALENLPKLSAFSLCTFEFPSLERLEIKNCPALKTFVSGFPEIEDPPAASNIFLENFDSLVKLKKLLIINQTGVEKLWHNKHPSTPHYALEVLALNGSNNLLNVISSSMLIGFELLKSFTVVGCEELTEVFDLGDVTDDDASQFLPSLSEFALICLPNLKHVWNKPQVSVFKNLTSLQIIDCDCLTKLFSLSTAEHLKELRVLKLYGCKNMKEVFVDEDEQGKIPEVNFANLECLILKRLPRLVSFCQQITTFNWPNLRIVRVSEIPEMETFGQGKQIAPKLRTVYVTFIKKCWQGDLNSTIQYMHNPEEFEKRKAMREDTSGEGTGEVRSEFGQRQGIGEGTSGEGTSGRP